MSAGKANSHNEGKSPDTVVITSELHLSDGLADLWAGLKGYEQWMHFAWHEIKQRFRRSVLGPFWITLSMGILVVALGMVFGGVFNQNSGTFIPYLATGLIFWGLITSIINGGSSVFISAATFIRDVPLPISSHYYQMVTSNLIIWVHNMVIYLIVCVLYSHVPTWNFVWFFPGFAIFLVNLFWMGLAIGILSTRFRDIPQVITNVIQVVFFATPVFWSIEAMPARPAFVTFNPAYHMLELVRAPLIGLPVPASSWVAGIVMAVVGTSATLWLYGRSKSRIPYWI